MRTALVKAIALPAVYRANLEFQSHIQSSKVQNIIITPYSAFPAFVHMRSRICARADAEGSAFIYVISMHE